MNLCLKLAAILACLVVACTPGTSADTSEQVLVRASELFGKQLTEHHVYRLNDAYVVWLSFDRYGNFFEASIGPRSHYSTEFPNTPKPAAPEHLSQAEYEDALHKISQLQDIGGIQVRHQRATQGILGPMNTDQFEHAFVDRFVAVDNSETVQRFNVYYLKDIAGSPEELKTEQEQNMVCLGGEWYYLTSASAARVQLGKSQTIQVAGPSMRGVGCTRTAKLYDADGFTIDNAPMTVEISEPYTVRALKGHVSAGGQSLEDVNFEVRKHGSKTVLRSKTDKNGDFEIPSAPEGTYKFKLTKSSYQAVTGTVIVDHHARPGRLSFEMPVGV